MTRRDGGWRCYGPERRVAGPSGVISNDFIVAGAGSDHESGRAALLAWRGRETGYGEEGKGKQGPPRGSHAGWSESRDRLDQTKRDFLPEETNERRLSRAVTRTVVVNGK